MYPKKSQSFHFLQLKKYFMVNAKKFAFFGEEMLSLFVFSQFISLYQDELFLYAFFLL